MSKSKSNKSAAPATPETESAKHSIPVPVVSEAPMLNVDDLINQYRPSVAPTTGTKSVKDRPVIDLDESTQKDFVSFAAAKIVLDDAKANHESKYKQVVEEVFDRWVDVLWETKTQPENPSIKAYIKGRLEATGLFTISTGGTMKIDMPAVQQGEPMERAMIRGLVERGVSEANAGRLVKQEISFVPQWEIDLTDMMRGVMKSGKLTPSTDVQKNAAGVLFLAIQGNGPDGRPLTPEGRLALLQGISEIGWAALQTNLRDNTTYAPMLKDGDTFLDRVCGYAENREELGCILGMFKPVRSMRSVEFAVSDNAEDRRSRLVEEAKEMVRE